jgi:hypothetical protein
MKPAKKVAPTTSKRATSKRATSAKSSSEQTKRSSPTRRRDTSASRLAAAAEALRALPARYERRPDRSIAESLYDANNLATLASKEWPKLQKKGGLEADTLDRLRVMRSLLERLEAEWTTVRKRTTPAAVERAREEGRQLRSEANAALRHFLRRDAEVQKRLSEISEGEGDADLIDDLRKLAALVEAHRDALRFAELPKDGSDALRKAAAVLSDVTSERKADSDAAAVQASRNRAYWSLRELMSEVRSAGRYVFRKEPKVAARFADPFRSTRTVAATVDDETAA